MKFPAGKHCGSSRINNHEKINIPRRSSNASPVLQRLIDQEPYTRKHEIGKGTTNAVEGHEGTYASGDCALTVMHRHVKMEDLRVGPWRETQQPFERVARHVRRRPVRQEHFDVLTDRHTEGGMLEGRVKGDARGGQGNGGTNMATPTSPAPMPTKKAVPMDMRGMVYGFVFLRDILIEIPVNLLKRLTDCSSLLSLMNLLRGQCC